MAGWLTPQKTAFGEDFVLEHDRDTRPLAWFAIAASLSVHWWLLSMTFDSTSPTPKRASTIDLQLVNHLVPVASSPVVNAPVAPPPPVMEPELVQKKSDRQRPEVRPDDRPTPQSSDTPATPTVGEQTEEVQAVERWAVPPPVFPPPYLDWGNEVTVALRIWVTRSGDPRDVEVTQSSGFPSLDDAAAQAALNRQFEPPMAGAAINKVVVFSIDQGPTADG